MYCYIATASAKWAHSRTSPVRAGFVKRRCSVSMHEADGPKYGIQIDGQLVTYGIQMSYDIKILQAC